MVARRLHVAVKTRSRSRNSFEREWYHRRERLVNRRRSSRQTDEVDEASRGLRLVATIHRGSTSGEHPLELEPALRPALTFTRSPRRRIRAFGTCAGKGWLHELVILLLLGHCFRAMRIIGGLREMGVSSCGERGDEPDARCCDAPVCMALVGGGPRRVRELRRRHGAVRCRTGRVVGPERRAQLGSHAQRLLCLFFEFFLALLHAHQSMLQLFFRYQLYLFF